MARGKRKLQRTVEALKHQGATRKNIPTAEVQSLVPDEQAKPIRVAYARRNRDLDPQLVWRGKDEQDLRDLVVNAPPLYIQEKIHPKVIIDDLMRYSSRNPAPGDQIDLFADFNGVPEGRRFEFYQHDANWTNRMILGDSLLVMASLAEREGLRGQVQCIYMDPPYGIKFNSNFQWSTTTREVRDGDPAHITREPEQVQAYRDTWRDGIHSYLSYLRDRLTVARELLHESGSIFVQIGDENVHRVRALLDEVFGEDNFVSLIHFKTTTAQASEILPRTGDYLLWYAKDISRMKTRRLYRPKDMSELASYVYARSTKYGDRRLSQEERKAVTTVGEGWRVYSAQNLRSQNAGSPEQRTFVFRGRTFDCGPFHHWKTPPVPGLQRLARADRIVVVGNNPNYVRFADDFPVSQLTNIWDDTAIAGFSGDKKRYVVETPTKVVQRCVLLTTDPGDLVLDPTCGSGTTAYVAEQWGRRWITIDTSRVALALARARIMGARYPYYILADSPEGQRRLAELGRTEPSVQPTGGNLRYGFVYERVPHITLKSIANNAEIDVIWEKYEHHLEPLRQELNASLGTQWEEWEIPRVADDDWPEHVKDLHARWWQFRLARQEEMEASISDHAEYEELYDRPYEDTSKVRVAGPFTVESISPHRVLGVDEYDELFEMVGQSDGDNGESRDFVGVVLEHLKTSGVQQAHKQDRMIFSSLNPWPGKLICAEGRYVEGDEETGMERRAAIFIGPEFGTVSRPDLAAAAREAVEAGFDVLIACAFNYDAHTSEFSKLGRMPVLKARMSAELHMAEDLKNTGKGNLFVIFGEPDIEILDAGHDMIQVRIKGVDVFHPQTGEIRSDGPEGIACWFIDTDYNEESFFVRHAYFLGVNDPYKALKTTLKAEINPEAWDTLYSDTSRAFPKPSSGRIAVKVINHLGDEVMKVFRVE